MKIYLDRNVYEEAIDRISYLFDEFDNVVVSFSGGKDSTVTLELALEVARRKNRLPLDVCFLDQEAEWSCVIDYISKVMHREEINPMWIQAPIFLPNSLSQEQPFLLAWEPDKQWMRDKDPIAITDIILEKETELPKHGYWYTYFNKILDYFYPDSTAAFLAGMRAEETPKRAAGPLTLQTYKHITWGKKQNPKKGHYSFYPIYDWSISDVWKYIHDTKSDYCKIYDEYYRYGLPVRDMRVSNLNHEVAVKTLFYLHEIEADTWERLQKRLKGINQAKHIKENEMLATKVLPPMFSHWREYRDYLTENLITKEAHRIVFRKRWARMDPIYDEMRNPDQLYRMQIKSILVNDLEFAKLTSYLESPPIICYRDWKKGRLGNRARKVSNLVQIKKEYLHAG